MFRYLTALFVATLILAPLSYSMSPALAATEDWPQLGDDIVGTSSNTETGKSVAISDDGSIIAVGSWELTAPGPGSVRVYELSSGSWTQIGSTLTGVVSGDYFGHGLALSADGLTLAVGAPFNGSSRGQVFVYTWDASATPPAWVPKGDTLTGTANNVDFGFAVSLSDDGDTLAVGSPKESVFTGKVSIFTWDASASPPAWGTPLDIAAEDAGENFGRALDLNADGTVVVDARGNLEARALLPALQPGDYDVVFQGKHRGGAGLRLTARITVGDVGQITVLDRNIPQVW
jgi:hypothetical protein